MSCCAACGKHGCACGCGAHGGTPLPLYNRPGLSSLAYRVGTWADFQATMQSDLSDAALPALAGLRTREGNDASMALIDAWAVGADVLSFYQERIANEGYLRTATERRSVLELARLTDYRLRPGVSASVYLAYTVEKDSPPVTVPVGARAQSIPAPGEQMQSFETSEPLAARHEWNVLKPRLTRPQNITLSNVDTLDELWIAGLGSNLRPYDRLLFVFGTGSGATPKMRQVRTIELDPERQRTRVLLQPVAAAVASSPTQVKFEALYGALTVPPASQPANRLRLARNVAEALGTGSDTRPQLLLHFDSKLAGSFYRAWTSVFHGTVSPELSGVFVMRVAAPLFGYNAPPPYPPPDPPPPVITLHAMASSDGDWQIDGEEQDDRIFLDNAYDGIANGGYVLIQAGTEEVLAQAGSVRVRPRTAYNVSGKTTQIDLADGTATWTKPSDMAALRKVQVFAQSEPLPLSEASIADDVGHDVEDTDAGRRVVVDTVLDGFEAGRWVIVEGRRADVPGTDAVSAAELMMIEAVEQGLDADLPGDTVHSTLVFAGEGLAYRYRRDSVSIHANVVHATHGETRTEVLGSGNGAIPMQAFVLKQSPLTCVSAATPAGIASTLSVRVNDVEWHETRNLAFVEPASRSFVTSTDDDGKTTVQFGDGTHGTRLPTGIENVRASYRNGIGEPGNVRARQISLLATKPLGIKEVINPMRASGGADAETRDQARANVPLAVLALDRLVSVRDYADFARTFGGVGKAVAVKLGERVQVTIAGAADAPVDVDSDLYRNLLQALRRYGDPLLDVHLDVRELLALSFSARVGLAPDHAWESVEPRVRASLLDAFGFERRALAQSAYLSEIVACIQAVRGVAWVDVDAFGSLDEDALLQGFSGGDVDSGQAGASEGPHKVLSIAAGPPARVPVQPARYDEGVLRPAQLAYLLPAVPDTLLLQEARS